MEKFWLKEFHWNPKFPVSLRSGEVLKFDIFDNRVDFYSKSDISASCFSEPFLG